MQLTQFSAASCASNLYSPKQGLYVGEIMSLELSVDPGLNGGNEFLQKNVPALET